MSELHIASPEEVEIVFYEAFMHCDIDVMAAIWARNDACCIHPGSRAINGYDAVIRSWKHILSNSQPPQIVYSALNRVHADDMAMHLIREVISSKTQDAVEVVATNVYRHYASGWLMVAHHASTIPASSQNDVTLQ